MHDIVLKAQHPHTNKKKDFWYMLHPKHEQYMDHFSRNAQYACKGSKRLKNCKIASDLN
jgi:hypothetical protein